MQYPQSAKRLPVDCVHYVAESLIAKDRHLIRNSPRKLLTLLCIPAGWLLKQYILKKVNDSC